jgi:hypothetical protein
MKLSKAISALAMGVAVLASSVAVSNRLNSYKAAFEMTQRGESLPAVIDRFGAPSIRETPSAPYLIYAIKPCESPCTQRLWWVHPIMRDIEAWSIEIDSDQRVVHKAHWSSP